MNYSVANHHIEETLKQYYEDTLKSYNKLMDYNLSAYTVRT